MTGRLIENELSIDCENRRLVANRSEGEEGDSDLVNNTELPN